MKVRTVLVVLLVLVCAPAARAEQLAPDISSKLPLPETVYCATDDADWQAQIARLHGDLASHGMTQVVSGTIHLPPETCAAMRAGTFNPASALLYRQAYHEFIHATLHTLDEGAAECWSLFMYRYWVRRFFGATVAQSEAAYRVSWADHLALPTNYQGACTFAARDLVSPLNGL